MFSDSFKKQPSPLQNKAIRKQLQEAILSDDPVLFRQILEGVSPDLANEKRLYSVLTLGEAGMVPVMVDQTGHRLNANDIIEAQTPIEQLNVDIVGNEMIATIGDQVFRALIGPMADQDEADTDATS